MKLGIEAVVDEGGYLANSCVAVTYRGDDGLFAPAAMQQVCLNHAWRIIDAAAMTGQVKGLTAIQQALQG